MNKKVVSLIFCFTVICIASLQSQTINSPNYALKSPETLNILKIETNSQNTVVNLSVENRREGGNFCADKNIYIVYPDGSRSKLISSKGIPVCPATHQFKAIGEKLNFELMFPAIRPGAQCIDLIEDCNENCFSLYGICLNNDLNRKIDEAFVLAESGEQVKAFASFNKIADSDDFKGSGIEGLVYMNLVELAKQTGKSTEAATWYNKLKSISIPRSELYIRHLNSQGIIY